MKVTNVLTEYLKNPIGIDIISPRIMWNLEGVRRQDAFEIFYKVNGKEHTSGIINSNSMHYDFKECFKCRTIVTFVIKALCDGNWVSSDENSFEIGLLNKEDWKANWISGNYVPRKKRRYPVDYFKKVFNLKQIKKARLYISACGLYEAFINGIRIGKFVLAPGSTDYRKRIQYQVYDVTTLLKEGNNELVILLADGWYRGSIGAKGFTCVFGKETSVIAQLEITDDSNHVSYILSDESFNWSNDGSIRFADLKDGEIVDNNCVPTFSNHAKIVKKNVFLSASNNTFIEEQEVFAPIKTIVTKSKKKLYEFNQNLAGIISFKVKANKGDIVNIKLGEKLDENGELTLKNIQCVRKRKLTPLQEVHLICKDGINEYHGKFTIAGFKYLEVDENIELLDLKQIALYSSLEETSTFECDNELINIFYRNTLWSLKSNSADVPTDCPTRERMGWTGDSQVFFNTASYLTNYAAFARKHIRDIFDRQDKNGRLPQIAPYNAEDWFMDVMNGSVGWADAGILIPYRFFLKYGDDRLIKRYYDDMVRYAKFMIKRCGSAKGIYAIYADHYKLSKNNKKYLVNTGQSYGEWAEPADVKSFVWTDFCKPHPEESMAYTIYVLSLMIEISSMLGKTENNALFAKYRDGIKRAYQELVDTKQFNIDTNRQAKLVRPLYMHLLNKDQEDFAKKRLLEALDFYDYRLGTGFLSTPFILDVLASYDVEACYRLLENEKMPGWLFMAKNSTGTIWEDWEGPVTKQGGTASLNHYSKGALVEWLINRMVGIKVVGENEFKIEPLIGGKEKKAKGSYQSIYGKISSSWEIIDGKIKFEILVPSNTKAVFKYNDIKKELEEGDHSFEVKHGIE